MPDVDGDGASRSAGAGDLHARAGELFLALRALPPVQRAAALARAAGADDALRAEVSSLLVHDVPDAATSPSVADTAGELELPDRIGPYRVLRRIGRGGFGQVFLAEQDEPVRRTVAIKIVPAAAHSQELAARLYVERRALERAEHPHIVRILDAGHTPSGLPFLAMEYVEGPSITAYCARATLGVVERVRLFLGVVDAVQHAHQRGVIHRDLKPANVLVSEAAGRASPRVLDFGIAKPIAGAFGEDSPPTLGLPMGTPAYMAPEQTGLGPVDTRADVYALGALLYELVAGRPPIDGADPIELLRRVREVSPEPASRVLRRSESGRIRDAAPRALLADLDVVLGKALEKEPARRFQTAAEFGADLERVLARLPIEARAPTLGYRAARFAERNRALTLLSVFALAALVVGVIGIVRNLRESHRREVEVRLERDVQDAINQFLIDDILLASSPDRAGPMATALDLLERASPQVEVRLPDQPLMAAAVHQALGMAYGELERLDRAEQHSTRALELRREHAGADAPETVRSEIMLADALTRRGDLARALPELERLHTRALAVLGTDDRDLYVVQNDLGVALAGLGRLPEAIELLEGALAGRTRLLGPTHRDAITTMSNLALTVAQAGDGTGALDLLREVLRRLDALPDPPRFTQIGILNNLGSLLLDLGRRDEALPHLERGVAIASQTLGPDHPGTLTLALNMAAIVREGGDPEGSAAILLDVVQRRERNLGPHAEDTLVARHGYWTSINHSQRHHEASDGFAQLSSDVERSLGRGHPLWAQTEISLARCLLDARRPEQALPHALAAEAFMNATYGPDHDRSVGARRIADEARAASAR